MSVDDLTRSMPPDAVRTAEWKRFVRQRNSGPLRSSPFLEPKSLRSLCIIVPGSSGDVILATTVMRYVKDRNPSCRITLYVKAANEPLAAMCPGADEIAIWPKEDVTNPRSRRFSLLKYADLADATIYPICDPEDMDLLTRFNFLETIWILSGVPEPLPSSQRFWIEAPANAALARKTLARCLGRGQALAIVCQGFAYPFWLSRNFRLRRLLAMPRVIATLWRNAFSIARHIASPDDLARAVIISSDALMFPPPQRAIFPAIARFLKSRGYFVLHNVLNARDALPGTVPLVCTYEEFLCLRSAGIPFIGWRSGLCDIAATVRVPMCTIYPSTFKGCGDLIQATMHNPLVSFGFAAMQLDTPSIEMVCDNVDDIDLERLAELFT